jgi:hypothetical protein
LLLIKFVLSDSSHLPDDSYVFSWNNTTRSHVFCDDAACAVPTGCPWSRPPGCLGINCGLSKLKTEHLARGSRSPKCLIGVQVALRFRLIALGPVKQSGKAYSVPKLPQRSTLKGAQPSLARYIRRDAGHPVCTAPAPPPLTREHAREREMDPTAGPAAATMSIN